MAPTAINTTELGSGVGIAAVKVYVTLTLAEPVVYTPFCGAFDEKVAVSLACEL